MWNYLLRKERGGLLFSGKGGGGSLYLTRINTTDLAGEDEPNDVREREGGEGGSAPSGASTRRRGNEAGAPRGGRTRGFGGNQG